MIISQEISTLSKPNGAVPVPLGTLGYFRARNRWRLYEMVVSEFLTSGITKADLARRMGRRPEVISRILGAPGNWGLDTVSDLLFSISGAEPAYAIAYPLDNSPRNDVQPEWLTDDTDFGWSDELRRQTAIEQPEGASKSALMQTLNSMQLGNSPTQNLADRMGLAR
jgi:hypothetical protein